MEDLIFAFISIIFLMNLAKYKKAEGLALPSSVFFIYTYISLLVFYVNDQQYVMFLPLVGMPLEMAGNYFYSMYIYVGFMVFFMAWSFILFFFHSSSVFTGVLKESSEVGFSIKDISVSEFKVIFFIIPVLFVMMLHFIDVDVALMLKNSEYLFIVDPNNVGLSNPITILFHHLTGPLGMIFAVIVAFSLKRKMYVVFSISLIILIYCVFVKFAQYSRWGPLILTVVLFSINYFFKSKSKTFFLIPFGFFVFICFLNVLEFRGSTSQGVLGFIDNFSFDVFGNRDLYQIIICNIFGGIIVLAEGLEVYWDYPIGYIIRVFSPFPSAIDGWSNFSDLTGRINAFSPFNIVIELSKFGALYVVFFSLFFFYVIYRLDFNYLRINKNLRVLPSALFAYVVFTMYYYPIRNVFRIIILCWFLAEYLRRKDTKGS